MWDRGQSKRIAFCSIICALSVMVLLVGIIPGIWYISIFVAVGISLELLDSYGLKYWIMWYIVVSTLGLILVPDIDIPITFIFMAWYTPIKDALDKLNKVIRTVIKTGVYLIASIIMYLASLFIFGVTEYDIGIFIPFIIAAFMLEFFLLDYNIYLFRKKILPLIHKRLEHKI